MQDLPLKLCKSLVRQHLEYCVSAWSQNYKKDKELMERIHHRFTKMILGFKELTCAKIIYVRTFNARRTREYSRFVEGI